MPQLLATATAQPPHRLPQEAARAFARRHFAAGAGLADLERLLPVFEHTAIEGRDLCQPLGWYQEPHSFAEKNQAAVEWGERLGVEAGRRCLEQAEVTPEQVGHLLFVSSTALATPSLDARLIPALGLSPHTRRTPIFGLGCAGGASGLALAARLAQAAPRELVLVVAVETTSLTFLHDDRSKSNLVASALFGDGAAAALVAGDEVGGSGPRITDTRSTLFEDSLDVMGWNVLEEGLQVVFSRAIPSIVRRHARASIEGFLADNGLGLGDVNCWVVHPGGLRVVEAYRSALDLPEEALHETCAVLRDHGNMSSATVLHVLNRFLSSARPGPGEVALLTALGPGFSAEHVLLRG